MKKTIRNGDRRDEGELVRVAIVERCHAKSVKDRLEADGMFHRDFRIATVDNRNNTDEDCDITMSTGKQESETVQSSIFVAIPIFADDNYEKMILNSGDLLGIRNFSSQYCRYSSAILGNNNIYRRLCTNGKNDFTRKRCKNNQTHQLSLIQSALVQAMCFFLEANNVVHDKTSLIDSVMQLNTDHCPIKLELLGDDRTVVLPLKAFENSAADYDNNNICASTPQSFVEFLRRNGITSYDEFTSQFLWKEVAKVLHSHRIVRRGEIDPDSPIRKSNLQIVWYDLEHYNSIRDDDSRRKSLNWITVTEQGIRQSFDMTKVMFSRGNISEKIRFGRQLVAPNELILDMYAGIGYFTLPALILGNARHVYCCEWNESAIDALRYNLYQNQVHARATIIQGDCRVTIRENNLYNNFDRVSLGLLPSSEGGWETAVYALHSTTGGWLHIHGNVPNDEVERWSLWLSSKVHFFVLQDKCKSDDWITVVAHVERVKSFAPKVSHYVADVFVGPLERFASESAVSIVKGRAGKRTPSGDIALCDDLCSISPPSCALSPDGILNQTWMIASENSEN